MEDTIRYLSSTARESLRWQYTAFVVIPSPQGLPPSGRHDENGVYAHLYVKHVTFNSQSCVSMEWGHFAPLADLFLRRERVRCCCSPLTHSWSNKSIYSTNSKSQSITWTETYLWARRPIRPFTEDTVSRTSNVTGADIRWFAYPVTEFSIHFFVCFDIHAPDTKCNRMKWIMTLLFDRNDGGRGKDLPDFPQLLSSSTTCFCCDILKVTITPTIGLPLEVVAWNVAWFFLQSSRACSPSITGRYNDLEKDDRWV